MPFTGRSSTPLTLAEDHHPFETNDSGQLPSSQHAPSDFELTDAGVDSELMNKFVTNNQFVYQYKHCLPLLGRATLKIKDQLQLEMLTPPPESWSILG